jgi:hypothetical protein
MSARHDPVPMDPREALRMKPIQASPACLQNTLGEALPGFSYTSRSFDCCITKRWRKMLSLGHDTLRIEMTKEARSVVNEEGDDLNTPVEFSRGEWGTKLPKTYRKWSPGSASRSAIHQGCWRQSRRLHKVLLAVALSDGEKCLSPI